MNSLSKVLVVDDGERDGVDPLAAELAGLGLSSVTTSLEAAVDVLGVIERPSAIFIRMPRASGRSADFLALATRLRDAENTSGVPVIMWDRHAVVREGGLSALLRTEIGPQAVAEPGA